MTRGNPKEVWYLQEEPGQNRIGNILYRLTESNDPSRKALAPNHGIKPLMNADLP